MFSRGGRRSPYAVIVPFAAVALVSTTTLAWLVREQLRQDGIVAGQRRQERFDQAAAAVTESLQRSVADINALAQRDHDPASVPDGVSIVRVTATETRVLPAGSLPFLPRPDSHTDSIRRATEFAPLEALEFAPGTSAQALAGYNRLVASRDPVARAAALVRIARMERKAGRHSRALASYDHLSSITAASVDGLPAPLVARVGRIQVLKEAGDTAGVRTAAEALRNDLLRGAWPVTKSQYTFYLSEADRQLPSSPVAAPTHADRLARADAVEQVWAQRLTLPASGHLVAGEPPTLLTWARSGDQWRIVVAGPVHLSRLWQTSVPAGFSAAYSTRDGRPLSESAVTNAHALVRNDAADRLPWTVHLAATAPVVAGSDSRRLLLLLVFGTVALVTVSGGYFIVHAIRRESRLHRMQSDFVAAVSHEFRSPLTSMYQIAQMLAGGRFASTEARERSYQLLMRETERLRQLVEGLLDFGRLEAGGAFRFERLDAASLVRATVAEFQEGVRADGYTIELAPTPDAVFVRADREALVRALWNLLDNAVKYSPDSRLVWVGLHVRDERCQITVRDQGLGIPAVEQRQIFARFIRGAESKARRIRGTGIGLAMVRQIARAHGGDVRLESEPGRGSCFTIELRTVPA